MTLTEKSKTLAQRRIGVEADMTIDELDVRDAEMIVLPGGLGGVASIRGCGKALEAVKAVYKMDKYVAAICAGPTVLADLGLLTGVEATCYPGQIPNMKDARVVENAACVTAGRIIERTIIKIPIRINGKLSNWPISSAIPISKST